ncbi:hypothetical protein ACI2KT_00990 [Ensifer adhaerens]|uniref:hypothetical protein n=1 Tax=Ensifer adhaerens TaxID=106592 RepID=UPI00384F49E4
MGVIRWEEMKRGPYDDEAIMWHGYLGEECICFVSDFGRDANGNGGWTMFTHREFPGHLHDEGHEPCNDLEHGKAMAEELLQEWLDEVGLTARPKQRTLDEADLWEYETVETARKSGTSHADRWPEGEGWEIDTTRGRVGTLRARWERFDYHEELYFRRRVPTVGEAA